MATVRIEDGVLHVELRRWDMLLTVHGSFAIPLQNVAGASTDKPPSFFASLKLIGTASPLPFTMAGTFLYHGEVVFFDYQREESVLVVDLAPAASRYKHLFVHVDEPDTPDAAAQRIRDALRSSAPTA